jgi:Family of unknown function (DUF6081)
MADEVAKGERRDLDWAGHRWQILEFPLADGGVWRHEEPSAQTSVTDDVLELRVQRFERSHDTVQIFDNPKHLIVSVAKFTIPRIGESVFSVQMAAEKIGGNPLSYRDGFASFNVLDFDTGSIFDHIATGRHALVVHERLLLPNITDPSDTFSWFVEAPLSLGEFDPTEFHKYAIAFDPAIRRVRWLVDDRLTFETRDVRVPDSLQVGFGLFTLYPFAGGRSVSLRGQGMAGRWRCLRVPG